MQFKEKTQIPIFNDRLSLSRNLTNNRQTATLSTHTEIKKQTDSIQKMKLKVYLTDDTRIFIDKAVAFSLGLIETRAIMLGNDQKVEITERQLATIKSRPNIEIEYEKLLSNKEIPEKPKIEVFVDNIDYYITSSAAYSLGLISVENFNTMQSELYKISDNLLEFLKNKYNVIYTELDNKNKKAK